MNPDFDLLASLAGIAGVFIGFGALIVLSGEPEGDLPELGLLRQVVAIGLLTLVGALVPVGLGQLGLEGLLLWRVASAVFFALIWFSILHPTSRRLIVAQMRNAPRSAAFFWLVLEPPIQVPLILVMLGKFPERASGLFIVAVVVNLVECAQLLAQVTYARVARARAAERPRRRVARQVSDSLRLRLVCLDLARHRQPGGSHPSHRVVRPEPVGPTY